MQKNGASLADDRFMAVLLNTDGLRRLRNDVYAAKCCGPAQLVM